MQNINDGSGIAQLVVEFNVVLILFFLRGDFYATFRNGFHNLRSCCLKPTTRQHAKPLTMIFDLVRLLNEIFKYIECKLYS